MLSSLSDRNRQRLKTIAIVLATALVIAPAAAFAAHSFTDVEDDAFYHEAVEWMKDNGVTVGCNPPANTNYCPDQTVTRGEMAVFLERLDTKDVFLRPDEDSVDGGDADTLDGKDSSDFANRLFAVVDHDGTLIRGRGATGVGGPGFPGIYFVDFDQDILDCSYTATIKASGLGPGVIDAASYSDDPGPKSVVVTTYDVSGDEDNRPFHLQVIC